MGWVENYDKWLLEQDKETLTLEVVQAMQTSIDVALHEKWMQQASRIDEIVGDALVEKLFERQDPDIMGVKGET